MVGEGASTEECKLSNASTEPTPPTDINDDKGSDSDGDAAEEILEESPDKRWSKRREKVKQRDVPGIDAAYLAMDNETGNEVVWNEVLFSERKNFREQEEKIKAVFDNLTHLVHVNLVKFHKYWTDTKSEKPRIIFITEYMSSGSMSRFLQRTRSSGTLLSVKAWKKWTTQILSALNYLHQCDPPIVHANLTCNTVFIQQNGLIKIGCVAPNAIHHHVKTFRENFKNMHYVAPEQERVTQATTQADIYSFGICALEMAMTGALIGGSTNSSATCNGISAEPPVVSASTSATLCVGPDSIRKSLETVEDPLQRDFIEKCLNPDPEKRPTARELLFHPVLFEVHSLKLIAAHVIVNTKLLDQLGEDDLRVADKTRVAFETRFKRLTYTELPGFQVDLEKFLEDVKNGIYPLIAFAPLAHLPTTKLHSSSSLAALTVTAADARNNVASADTRATENNLFTGVSSFSRNSAGADTVGNGGYDDYHRNAGELHESLHSSPEPNLSSVNKLPTNTSQTQQLQHHKNGYNGALIGASGGVGAGSFFTLAVSASTDTSLMPTNEYDEGYHTAQNFIGSASAHVLGSGTDHRIGNTGGGLVAAAERPHEARLIRHMQASVDGASLQVLLRFDDQMNRQLTTEISNEDTSENLVVELVQHGFISEVDSSKMCVMLEGVLSDARKRDSSRQNSPV